MARSSARGAHPVVVAGVELRQRRPARRVEQGRLGVRQHLQGAGEPHHHLLLLAPRHGEVERGEVAHERVAAHEHVGDAPGAAVGRAQLDQPAAGALLEPLPQLRVEEGGACHQPAHGMGHDADRLVGRGQRIAEHGGEGLGVVEDRAPPVVAPGSDVVGSAEETAELAVVEAQRLLGDDVRLIDRQATEAAERELRQVDPDSPFPALVDTPEHRPGDAGQDEDDRPLLAAALGGCRDDADLFGRDRLEAAILVVGAQQPLDHPLRGLGVAEIGEMADLGPLGEGGARRRVAGHAAVHGAGVDDEVVVLAEEQVGRQDLEPAQDAGPLDVALEHGQIGGGGDARPVQQPDQRRPRDHRLEAGNRARRRPAP